MAETAADTLLQAGDLDGARVALVEAVRRQPGDARLRLYFFSLLAIIGEWDKARTQLKTLAQLSPEAQMLSVVYGQAIDAEVERAAVFAGTNPVRLHVASGWAMPLIDAVQAFGQGDLARGVESRDAAFDAAPDTPGEIDGVAFDWIADADGRFGPSFEAIIGGRYGLQTFDMVERITSEGAEDLRDLAWYPVQIAFRDGQSVAALLPTRYPGEGVDPTERLARVTNWNDRAWGQQGVGQHLWALSTGDEAGLLSLRSLTFC